MPTVIVVEGGFRLRELAFEPGQVHTGAGVNAEPEGELAVGFARDVHHSAPPVARSSWTKIRQSDRQ
jgi:hypothetical protein